MPDENIIKASHSAQFLVQEIQAAIKAAIKNGEKEKLPDLQFALGLAHRAMEAVAGLAAGCDKK